MPYAPAIGVESPCGLLFISGATPSPLYHKRPHVIDEQARYCGHAAWSQIDPKATLGRSALLTSVRTFGSARSGPLADLDDGGFRRRSTRTSVRPIDVLNALSGFCSSAARCGRPDSAGNVKKADLLRVRVVERMNRLGGRLQQDRAALIRKIRLSFRR